MPETNSDSRGGIVLPDTMMFLSRKVTEATRILVQRHLTGGGLRPNHLAVIAAIGRLDAASQKDIIELVPFDKSYISTTVRELIDMGLVVNTGRGKSHHLELTDSGSDALILVRVVFESLAQNLLDGLTPDERGQLMVFISKIEGRADEIIASEISGNDG